LHALLVSEGILETVTKDDTEGEAVTHFVRTRGGFGGPNTLHFAEAPMFGGIEPFKMFFGTANHDVVLLFEQLAVLVGGGTRRKVNH